jgi:hypothetical protein
MTLGRICAAGLVAIAAGAASAECRDDALAVRGAFGTAQFTVEIADDSEERARGLMFVEDLPASAGMLFVYDRPGPQSFWMKNTLIPLDMLFIRPDGVVQHVHDNAVPGDLTPITGGDGVLAVLEINGGLAGQLGIEAGAEIRHPAFGPEAAWPCPGPEPAE